MTEEEKKIRIIANKYALEWGVLPLKIAIQDLLTQEKRELLEGLRMEDKQFDINLDPYKISDQEILSLLNLWVKGTPLIAKNADILVQGLGRRWIQAVKENNQSIDKELEKLK